MGGEIGIMCMALAIAKLIVIRACLSDKFAHPVAAALY